MMDSETCQSYLIDHFLVPIFDFLEPVDIRVLSRVNVYINAKAKSEEYWHYRAVTYNIFGTFKQYSSHISNPMTRFIWSSLISSVHRGRHHCLNPDDVIFLSKQDLLFPGFELVLGLNDFLIAAVRKNDLILCKYAISLGPNPTMIRSAISLAVELDHKDLAYELSAIINDWGDFNGRYCPDIRCDSPRFLTSLVKYGNHDPYDQHHHAWIWGNSNITKCLIGLAEKLDKSNLSNLSNREDVFIDLINGSKLNQGDLQDIGESLGRRGTKKMVDAYLAVDKNPDYLVESATDADNIEILRHICLNVVIKHSLCKAYTIRSKASYEILGEESSLAGVAYGGNYELFYTMSCDKQVKIPWSPDHVPGIMILEIIKENVEQAFENIRVRFGGSDHRRIGPYLYDLLRRFGLPKETSLVRIEKYVEVENLPYLKEDLKT